MALAGIGVPLLLTVCVVAFVSVCADSPGDSDVTSRNDIAGHGGETALQRFKRARFRFRGFRSKFSVPALPKSNFHPLPKYDIPILHHSRHKSHVDVTRNRGDDGEGGIGRKHQIDADDAESKKNFRDEDDDVIANDDPKYKETRKHVDTFLSGISHPAKNKVRRKFREIMGKTVKGSPKDRAKARGTLKKAAKFLLEYGPDAIELAIAIMDLIQTVGQFQAEAQPDETATSSPFSFGMSPDQLIADDRLEDEELLLMLQMMMQEQKSDASHVTSGFKIFPLVLMASIWVE